MNGQEDIDKENEAFNNIYQLEASRIAEMERTERRPTREELLRQWKHGKTAASRAPAKAALQKANPNVAKVKNSEAANAADLKNGKRPTTKPAKAGVKSLKDAENDKHTAKKRSKVGSQSSQDSQEGKTDNSTDDEAFNPELLGHRNVRHVLDSLDDNIERERRKQQGETVEENVPDKPTDTTQADKRLGPIALLQRELTAKNDDIQALQERLTREIERANRLEMDIFGRCQEADEARAELHEKDVQLMVVNRTLMDKEDILDELKRKLIRKNNEHALDKKRILDLTEQVDTLTAKIAEFSEQQGQEKSNGVAELQSVSKRESVTEGEARLQRRLAEKDEEIAEARNSYEDRLKQLEANIESSTQHYENLQKRYEMTLSECMDLSQSHQELDELRQYFLSIGGGNEDCGQGSLATQIQQLVKTKNRTIGELQEEKEIQRKELEECCDEIERLERQMIEADEFRDQYPEVVAKAEDLQTKLMSTEVQLMEARDQLEQAQATIAKLREALYESLEENEQLHSLLNAPTDLSGVDGSGSASAQLQANEASFSFIRDTNATIEMSVQDHMADF